jgi:hypothetical protein
LLCLIFDLWYFLVWQSNMYRTVKMCDSGHCINDQVLCIYSFVGLSIIKSYLKYLGLYFFLTSFMHVYNLFVCLPHNLGATPTNLKHMSLNSEWYFTRYLQLQIYIIMESQNLALVFKCSFGNRFIKRDGLKRCTKFYCLEYSTRTKRMNSLRVKCD